MNDVYRHTVASRQSPVKMRLRWFLMSLSASPLSAGSIVHQAGGHPVYLAFGSIVPIAVERVQALIVNADLSLLLCGYEVIQ